MSALPPIGDIHHTNWHVRLSAISDHSHRSKLAALIRSPRSALASKCRWDSVRPSALAVLRLITSSNISWAPAPADRPASRNPELAVIPWKNLAQLYKDQGRRWYNGSASAYRPMQPTRWHAILYWFLCGDCACHTADACHPPAISFGFRAYARRNCPPSRAHSTSICRFVCQQQTLHVPAESLSVWAC